MGECYKYWFLMWVVMLILSNRLNGKGLTFDYKTNTITLEIVGLFKAKSKLNAIVTQISRHVQLNIDIDDSSSLSYNLYHSEKLTISLMVSADTYLINNFSTIDKAFIGLFNENGYITTEYHW
ncbi:hypothetical protein [Helicobacter cetorum]|uniref:Uncharacterized protein n=1 Tax=Helicobacter cetorum (strain ATCC BAA-429 / MIT 00-7128) TaxID=182217 RepID=I0EP25_HELC0|nr:hypothetical protein [Helicobacter cetorum]AFI04694.1 hypothetical protein HCW_07180 [Helicobacter cetorum MIT 00-7128]